MIVCVYIISFLFLNDRNAFFRKIEYSHVYYIMSESSMMALLRVKYDWLIIPGPDNNRGVYHVQILQDNITGLTGDHKRVTISPIYYDNGTAPKQFNVTISPESPDISESGVHYTYTTDSETGILEYTGEYGICCMCGDPCNSASQACGRCVRNPLSMWM